MPPPVPGTGASRDVHHHEPVPVQPGPPAGHAPYTRPDKSLVAAYVWWFFLGYLGAHQFYLGKGCRGAGYVLTVGWFLIAWFVDLFTLPAQVKRVNHERRAGLR
ncbi:TM2 domain-containing protein [Isoptericola sp. b408]|uniref:TM2 domain-containing protein n=1 Tax=Isoptericola sp. b408 TaxID=3064653 RepID=UPI002713CC44|nr:TM2 domain-containing protein [Isoptericola sp. b408]MDO8150191.1 TM2 domain-containing protein [Isoptericola sp. b408]